MNCFVSLENQENAAGAYQVIPGNDQNTSLTNQKAAGSNLERTS